MAAEDIVIDPNSWFDLGISYASMFELVLLSLALVNYASDMPEGKSDLIDYCQGIVNDSPDYQGHDQRWLPPDSWRSTHQLKDIQARQRITDAMSMRHKGGDVQAIEYVAHHTFGVTLVANDIDEYKRRVVLGPKENERKRKPLLDPSGASKYPESRLVGMLPAVARIMIAKFDNLDGLLQQAVHLLPANVYKEGSPQSSAQAPSQLPGDNCTRPIRRKPRSSRVTWMWSEEARQRGKENFKIFFKFIFSNPYPIRQRGMRLSRRSALRIARRRSSNDNRKTNQVRIQLSSVLAKVASKVAQVSDLEAI